MQSLLNVVQEVLHAEGEADKVVREVEDDAEKVELLDQSQNLIAQC
jgi:hypothetical protein